MHRVTTGDLCAPADAVRRWISSEAAERIVGRAAYGPLEMKCALKEYGSDVPPRHRINPLKATC